MQESLGKVERKQLSISRDDYLQETKERGSKGTMRRQAD